MTPNSPCLQVLTALALGGLLVPSSNAAAETLDEPLYAALLTRHTSEVPDLAGTRVDYTGLRRSADWRRLVANLERTDPASLATRNEKLAYWINTYNILAIDVVVEGDPEDSIKDLGWFFSSVWKKRAARIAAEPVTLHQIEHEILRPLGDPRIHAAIVCASLSCPSLRREPFTASRLDAQLDDALRVLLADRRKGLAVHRSANRVELSRIFDWFGEDFAPAGGVMVYVARHAPEHERAWLERHGADASLRYFDYDWSLNDLARAPGGG